MTDNPDKVHPVVEVADDDAEYFRRLCNYSRGCPGIGREDVCEDPAACAADGGCRELAEQRARARSEMGV